MTRIISKACAAICGVLLAILTVVSIVVHQRMRLDYDNGIYFDEQTLLVYSEGTVVILWFVICVGVLMFAGFFWLGRKVLKLE
jgi:hypothetical protein